jgi:hypothetical protein
LAARSRTSPCKVARTRATPRSSRSHGEVALQVQRLLCRY